MYPRETANLIATSARFVTHQPTDLFVRVHYPVSRDGGAKDLSLFHQNTAEERRRAEEEERAGEAAKERTRFGAANYIVKCH